MLRIHKGHEEHYVWPVHLPGWLALGWQVAGSGNAPDAGPLPQVVTALAAVLEPTSQATAIETGPEPSTGRGKRGRRRKEEEPPTAVVETAPAVIGIADEEGNADSEPPAAEESTDAQSSTEPAVTSAASDVATGPAAESDAVPAAAEAITEPDVLLSALPDDLFDDPLI
jgi:hypothetical protein